MAVSTSVVGGRADTDQRFIGQTFFFLAPLVLPLFILGVPVLDLLFAIVRRATRRKALDVADKGHLHHRLMNLGHGHRRSVLILWTWTVVAVGVRALPGALRARTRRTCRSGWWRSASCSTRSCTRASAGDGPTAAESLSDSPNRRRRRQASGGPGGLVAGSSEVRRGRRPCPSPSEVAGGARRRRPTPTHASAPPTEMRATPASASAATSGPPRQQEHVHRAIDGADDRPHVLDRNSPGA